MGNKYTKLGNMSEFEPFYFKGLKNYKICNICPVCYNYKFTQKDIAILSDKNLNYQEFKINFPSLESVHAFVCNNTTCSIEFHNYKKKYYPKKEKNKNEIMDLKVYWAHSEFNNYYYYENTLIKI